MVSWLAGAFVWSHLKPDDILSLLQLFFRPFMRLSLGLLGTQTWYIETKSPCLVKIKGHIYLNIFNYFLPSRKTWHWIKLSQLLFDIRCIFIKIHIWYVQSRTPLLLLYVKEVKVVLLLILFWTYFFSLDDASWVTRTRNTVFDDFSRIFQFWTLVIKRYVCFLGVGWSIRPQTRRELIKFSI